MAGDERASVSDEPPMDCRLCLDTVLESASGEDAILTFPCDCSAPVHIGCLRHWQDVQVYQAISARRSFDESTARADTCEVCGARLVTAGDRERPFASTAICRAHGGFGLVALRRVPTLSRATRNFTEFSAAEGQHVEVLERDSTGEFYRVRATKARRYREEGTVSVAQGWLRHVYLEWPEEIRDVAASSTAAPRMPAAYGERTPNGPRAIEEDGDGLQVADGETESYSDDEEEVDEELESWEDDDLVIGSAADAAGDSLGTVAPEVTLAADSRDLAAEPPESTRHV